MSAIHFVGGEKGGVGKSVVSRLLAQYFVDNATPFIAFDADQSHATLSRYYKDYCRPVIVDEFETCDEIIEVATSQEQQVLIDLPSQSERFLDRWFDENAILDMCQELQVPVFFWYVVDDGPDSVQLLDGFLAKYQHLNLHCILVKNFGRGSDFSPIEMLNSVQTAEKQARLTQINLRALHPATMRKLERLHFSFWAATNLKENGQPHLKLMERQRTKVWLERAFSDIQRVIECTYANQTLSDNNVLPFEPVAVDVVN